MLAKDASLYDIYTTVFGKVRSGAVLTDKDYHFPGVQGVIPYNEKQRLAVTLAVDDIKNGKSIRTKPELEAEIQRLLA